MDSRGRATVRRGPSPCFNRRVAAECRSVWGRIAALGHCVARCSGLCPGVRYPHEQRMNLIQLVADLQHVPMIPIQFDLQLAPADQLHMQVLPDITELAFNHRQDVVRYGARSAITLRTLCAFGSPISSRTPARRYGLAFDHQPRFYKYKPCCQFATGGVGGGH